MSGRFARPAGGQSQGVVHTQLEVKVRACAHPTEKVPMYEEVNLPVVLRDHRKHQTSLSLKLFP